MQPVSFFKWQLTVFQRPLFKELANRLKSLDLRQSGRRLYFGGNHATDSIKEPTLLQIEISDIGRREVRKTAPFDVRGSPEAGRFVSNPETLFLVR